MRVNPASRASDDRAPDVGGIVRAPETGEDVRHHRLDAEAQPVYSGAAIRRELRRVDAVGVALDGDLGVVGALDRVEDARQLLTCDQRRCPSAEEDARDSRKARGAAAREVGDARVDVGVDQMAAVGPGREVAVVAPGRAERDVHVHAEPFDRNHAPSSRAGAAVGPACRRARLFGAGRTGG